ncbi:MAG TPA: NUDIX hydrolase [Chloroflexota bacterium]|jgi:8-oxo-dGTP pyrophosphatase MutT (NUDIX family)
MTDLLDLSGENPWQTRTSEVLFENGHLRLRHDRVIQPDGAPGSYAYVEIPWAVVGIVPISDDGCVHLVRQWRYPWRRNSWEIPAGRGEPNETPLEGAKRELAEEVGLQAADWEPLGTSFGSAAVDAFYHLYLARGLSLAAHGAQRDGAEQDMIARPVPLVEAIEAAMDGRIVHLFTVAGLLRAARRLGV